MKRESMALLWDQTCSPDTLARAWKSFNGVFNQSCHQFAEFKDAFLQAPYKTVTQDEFTALCAENSHKLDQPNELAAEQIAATAQPQQPLVLGRFGDRVVILDGTTRYRAAELRKSDIRYVCIDMDMYETACAGCIQF